MAKPVRSWTSRAVARRMSGALVDRREPAEIDPVVAGDEAQDGLRARRSRDDEDERLHDLAELGADGGCRLDRGVGRLVEGHDLERHALAGGGIEDALDRGMDWGVGHGPESSIGRRSGQRGRVAWARWSP